MRDQRTRVMGVLVGDVADHDEGRTRALALVADGADIVTVRWPGAGFSEMRRFLRAVVPELVAAGVRVCVETAEPDIALAAAEYGGTVVRDLSTGTDRLLLRTVAEAGLTLLAPCRPARGPHVELGEAVDRRRAELEAVGLTGEHVVVEPRLGGSSPDIAWRQLLELAQTRFEAPVLVAASNRALMHALLSEDATPIEKDAATVAVAALAARAGAWAVRVDNVARTSAALQDHTRSAEVDGLAPSHLGAHEVGAGPTHPHIPHYPRRSQHGRQPQVPAREARL